MDAIVEAIAFHGDPEIPEARSGYLFCEAKGTRIAVKSRLTSDMDRLALAGPVMIEYSSLTP